MKSSVLKIFYITATNEILLRAILFFSQIVWLAYFGDDTFGAWSKDFALLQLVAYLILVIPPARYILGLGKASKPYLIFLLTLCCGVAVSIVAHFLKMEFFDSVQLYMSLVGFVVYTWTVSLGVYMRSSVDIGAIIKISLAAIIATVLPFLSPDAINGRLVMYILIGIASWFVLIDYYDEVPKLEDSVNRSISFKECFLYVANLPGKISIWIFPMLMLSGESLNMMAQLGIYVALNAMMLSLTTKAKMYLSKNIHLTDKDAGILSIYERLFSNTLLFLSIIIGYFICIYYFNFDVFSTLAFLSALYFRSMDVQVINAISILEKEVALVDLLASVFVGLIILYYCYNGFDFDSYFVSIAGVYLLRPVFRLCTTSPRIR